MSEARPEIPLPMKRAVRQRCGFGCVVCGMPLYEYEHLLGWAEVKRHVAAEITLLCDQHHREKTSGLLPADAVAAANSQPFNLRMGVSKPYDLHYSGSFCEAIVGGNSFTTTDAGYGTSMAAIVIDGTPMLGFVLADGHLLLHMNLFSETNELVLSIRNNELVYSVSPWDVRLVGRRLEIREASGQFLVDISFEPPNVVRVTRGRFLYNGVEIVLDPNYALITNNRTLISECSDVNCVAGLVIGPTDDGLLPCMFRVPEVSRYSLERREEATAWANARLSK